MNTRRLLVKLLFLACACPAIAQNTSWVGTWASASEWAGGNDLPKTSLANRTIRQVIRTSIAGNTFRMKLSNEFSEVPVEIRQIYLSLVDDSSAIQKNTSVVLRVKGKHSFTIEKGKALYTDAFKMNIPKLSRVAVTICYGNQVPEHMTSHRGSRTTSYIAQGMVSPKQTFKTEEKLDHWYTMATLETKSDKQDAIAILGNSITDGRGTTTNAQNRWPDRMAEALNGETGVLNLGIGGNCVVEYGISEPALKRFDRDILSQQGISSVVIFEGTNDIGISNKNYEHVADTLIASYRVLASRAKAKGLKVYGATITPTKGNGWYSLWHEAIRQTVNAWIRQTDVFDGVIDFDKAVRDPKDEQQLLPAYSEDGLHLNPEGYRVMGEFAASFFKNLKNK
ncbi:MULTISPECIES: SGNH/GDSL hydrolase family protein [Segatella]|jgi:lysophospholipase L1-like esterase|uniref:SGNH/GDSL hydrolase family protein n=1 Tax=Segatella TaxID=2974251 RepID=UPI00040E8E8D|nr:MULTISPECIES: SGNH/GDSL hydrolase family protein [Segatella]SEA63906.1 Lysophospholipase L1 [Segatella bryantii]